MKFSVKKIISLFTAAMLLLGALPAEIVHAAAGSIPVDTIAEFADAATARYYAGTAGGNYIGGPFVHFSGGRGKLESLPILSFTENAIMSGASLSNPADPLIAQQYYLTQDSLSTKDAWSNLDAYLSRNSLTPEGCAPITVAVIDSGIDGTHEDLAGRVEDGWDAVNNTAISRLVNSDVSNDGHGTKVAGLIAAASDNEKGIAGMSWTFPVHVIPVRALNNSNDGTVADIVSAIYWAVDEAGADILNLSFGRPMSSVPTALQTAVNHAIENGTIVIAAAGNDGEIYNIQGGYCFYPAALDGVYAVASLAKDKYSGSYVRAGFSNYSYYDYDDSRRTIFYVPGEDLLTTAPGNSYAEFTGTSASAALFSGMLATLKSFGAATNLKNVENTFLSGGKNSYLGNLYYQNYASMVTALTRGTVSTDATFAFDAHTPSTVSGIVTLSGYVYDPGLRFDSVRLYVNNTFISEVARDGNPQQRVSFTLDTTLFPDKYYSSYDGIVVKGVSGSGEAASETKLTNSGSGIYISNNSPSYTLSVISNGSPLVGVKVSLLYGNGTNETAITDVNGEILIDPSLVLNGATATVATEDLVAVRELAPYPAGGRYTLGNDPAYLTIHTSISLFPDLQGVSVMLDLPDGTKQAITTITGEYTVIAVDTDRPLTFRLRGSSTYLYQTLDLSSSDAVWDLDSASRSQIEVSTDGAGVVAGIELVLDGEEYLFTNTPAQLAVTPGEYPIQGYTYLPSGSSFNYIQVDFGLVDVNGTNLYRSLTFGSGTPQIIASYTPSAPVVGQPVTISFSGSDSASNLILACGETTAVGKHDGNLSVSVDVAGHTASPDSWEPIASDIFSAHRSGNAFAQITLPGSFMGLEAGERRVTISGDSVFAGYDDFVLNPILQPQETRPSARLAVSMTDVGDMSVYKPDVMVELTDAMNNLIVRKGFSDDTKTYIELPVGAAYDVYVVGYCDNWEAGYKQRILAAKVSVDLTAVAAGSIVDVSVTVDASWKVRSVNMVSASSVPSNPVTVAGIGIAPFADFPDAAVSAETGNDYDSVDELVTMDLGMTDVLFRVTRFWASADDTFTTIGQQQAYFTVKVPLDLSLKDAVQVGAPETLSLVMTPKTDRTVTAAPTITDAFGNAVVATEIVTRGEASELDMGEIVSVEPLYPVITIRNNANTEVATATVTGEPIVFGPLAAGAYTATLTLSCDLFSLQSVFVPFTVGNAGPVAVTVPDAPQDFHVSAAGTTATLTWTAPASGCTGYLLLRDGVTIAEPAANAVSYTDPDGMAGTIAMYTLYAVGTGGLRSEAVSAGVRFSAAPDTTAPVWGTSAALNAVLSEDGATLTWDRASDAGTGVTGYRLTCNGTVIGQLYTRRFVFTALQPDTDHVFTVCAVDGAGNVSEPLTSGVIRVQSGILGVSLDYSHTRTGLLTGTSVAVTANTTTDLTSAQAKIRYTPFSGIEQTETVDMDGSNGRFTTTFILGTDLLRIDSILITASDFERECLDEPLLRYVSHAQVSVSLAEAALLFPETVLTFYSPTALVGVSYTVEGMNGIVDTLLPAAPDYRMTFAAPGGTVLFERTVDLTSDTSLTIDNSAVRFLKVTLVGAAMGTVVSVDSRGEVSRGTVGSDGTVIWSSGNTYLPAGNQAIVSSSVLVGSQPLSESLTLQNTVNEYSANTSYYTIRTINVTVLDPNNVPIPGITVSTTARLDQMGTVRAVSAVTDANGHCVLITMENPTRRSVVSSANQQTRDGRCWLSASERTLTGTMCSVVLRPVQGYDTLAVAPLLDASIDASAVSFKLNGEDAALLNGVLYQYASNPFYQLGQEMTLRAEYTGEDGNIYAGTATFPYALETQQIAVTLPGAAEMTLSLTSAGDPARGIKRYYVIADLDGNVIKRIGTYNTQTTVPLVNGQMYSFTASWLDYATTTGWISSGLAVRKYFTAGTESSVALDLDRNTISESVFGQSFMYENGFSGKPSLRSSPTDGRILVSIPFTQYPLYNVIDGSAFNYIVLPDEAADVGFNNTSNQPFQYDEATHTISLLNDLKNGSLRIQTLVFTLPRSAVKDAVVESYARFETTNGTEFIHHNPTVALGGAFSMYLRDQVNLSALSEGVDVRVTIVGPKRGTLTLYDGTEMLASRETYLVTDYDFTVFPSLLAGDHKLKAVYRPDEGEEEVLEATLRVLPDNRPAVLSAQVRLPGSWDESYRQLYSTETLVYNMLASHLPFYCKATISNPDKVAHAWLVADTESELYEFELFREGSTNTFSGSGLLGGLNYPVMGLWVDIEEIPPTAAETSYADHGSVEWDKPIIGTPGVKPSDVVPSAYPGDTEAQQSAAVANWNQYVGMVQSGLFDSDENVTIQQLESLFDANGTWALPGVTDGEYSARTTFIKDPALVAAKLASDEAFTVTINGEQRRVLIEVGEENGGCYMTFYGIGDLFFPSVTDDETVLSGAGLPGKLYQTLKQGVKDWGKTVIGVKKTITGPGKMVTDGLIDDYKNNHQNPNGNGDSDPCSSSGSNREKRRQDLDKHFDKAKQNLKKVEDMTWALKGYGPAVDAFFDESGSLNTLLDLQKQHLNEIDDILYNNDPTQPAGKGSNDPCDDDDDKDDDDKKDKKNGKGGKGGNSGFGSSPYRPIHPLVDPSGYVWQGAAGYAAEGVKAYIYYLESDGITWTLWNTEDFGQPSNPFVSMPNGYYGWDVVPGKWKVVYEGEGYAHAESTVLDVPPPHTDVDISLRSTKNPSVEVMGFTAAGELLIRFDQPMDISSVTDALKVTLGVETLTGTLTPIDPAVTALGAKQAALTGSVTPGVAVATIFRFTPDDVLLSGMTVRAAVDMSALSYSGMPLTADFNAILTIPATDATPMITGLERTSANVYDVDTGKMISLAGEWNAIRDDGFGTILKDTSVSLVWTTNAPGVATVDANGNVTGIGAGTATITGSYDDYSVSFGIRVTRVPVKADAAGNKVRFCRTDNLVFNKPCWLYSDAVNFRLEDPMDGDEKFMPVAWRIIEQGSITAQGTVPVTESAIKVRYTPNAMGNLTGEIDYQKYVYTSGNWVASGAPITASKVIPVTEVTGLLLAAAPGTQIIGKPLDLDAMQIAIKLSDGTTSTVAYGKLAGYGITLNHEPGDTVSATDTELILFHARTNNSLTIPLTLVADPNKTYLATLVTTALTNASASLSATSGIRATDTVTLTIVPAASKAFEIPPAVTVVGAIPGELTKESGGVWSCKITSFTEDAIVTVSGNAVTPAVQNFTVSVAGGTTANHAVGSTVTVTAPLPPSGQVFKEWQGADALTFTSGNKTTATISFVMPAAAVTLSPVYEAASHKVTVTGSAAAVTGAGTYKIGQTVNVFAGTQQGFTFVHWDTVGITLTDPSDPNATFVMPDAEVTLTAVWQQAPSITPEQFYLAVLAIFSRTFTIRAEATPGGTISNPGETTARYSTSLTYLITPGPGYEISAVLVDGKDVGPVTAYTFERISAAHTISAFFRPIAISDVSDDDIFFTDVLFAVGTGLMDLSKGAFMPDKEATRAEFVSALWRLAGKPEASEKLEFSDVDPSEDYAEAIRWAASCGIVNGYEDGTFRPNASLTAEAALALLHRFADDQKVDSKPGTTGKVPTCSKWAEKDVRWAAANGLLTEYAMLQDMTAAVDRASVASLLCRFCSSFSVIP